MVSVSQLTDAGQACTDFVRRQRDARICHLPAWSAMLERAFGHRAIYLVARQENAVSGVLPLLHIRSRLFGNRMVSTGFTDYGGPLAENEEALRALFDAAAEAARQAGCRQIEFRNIHPMPFDLPRRSDKMTMLLPLTENPEDLWKALDPKVRNQVRKPEKAGLTVESGGVERIEEFYPVYAVRMRELGTPAYAKRALRSLGESFPDESRIFVVRQGPLVIGAALTLCFNGIVEIPYAATLVSHNHLSPNNLLYWRILEHHCRQKARVFDFGRCTVGSSTHRFKKQWGPEPLPLSYQYWVGPGEELAVLSPDSPRYRRKVELWRRLPLWLTNCLSPAISRDLV